MLSVYICILIFNRHNYLILNYIFAVVKLKMSLPYLVDNLDLLLLKSFACKYTIF